MLKELTKGDKELIQNARKLIAKRYSKRSTVAASLRTKSGKVYNGVCIIVPKSEPCTICAEYSAVAKMWADSDEEIDSIVAVYLSKNKKYTIFSPCGKCRQFLSSFGDPYIILDVKGEIKKAKLSDITLFQY